MSAINLIKMSDVVEITNISEVTINKMIKKGEFPKKIQGGKSGVSFNKNEIITWVKSRNVKSSRKRIIDDDIKKIIAAAIDVVLMRISDIPVKDDAINDAIGATSAKSLTELENRIIEVFPVDEGAVTFENYEHMLLKLKYR